MKMRFTKTGLIFTLAIIYANLINAQDYMITFTGSGQSNEVETVEVKNTTQQTTLTLNGTDTLYLVGIVGIRPVAQEYAGMKVYPNPTRHTSRVEFYNPEAGNVIVEIIEISGKILGSVQIYLTGGMQAFELRDMSAGIFILKATTETTVYQQRLITHSQSNGNPQINYIGSFDPLRAFAQLKSTKNIIEMQYNPGERLVIKGNSGDYSHTKSLIPNESQNIDFDFIECIDVDGNNYGVVTIGDQVWMAENLKTTQYRNGTPIENPTGNSDWQNNTTGAYVWYNNDIGWKDSYGALYNWHATNNASGLCPTGWHAPSNAEWTQLVDYVVAQGFPNQSDDPRGAGSALKSCRQVNSPLGGDCSTSEHPRWNSNSTHHGFDEFGFSGLPGGNRASNGIFYSIGNYGFWWSSTEDATGFVWVPALTYTSGGVSSGNLGKSYGFSVLCLRD